MNHLKLTLLISSFVIPLILAATLFLSSKDDFPKKVIGFALFNTFFVFFANYFYFQKLYATYSWVHSLHIATVLWIFPSIFLYIKAIITDKENFKKDLAHLIPGLIFGIISAAIFYGFLNLDERTFYLSNYRTETEFSSLNLKVLSIFRSTDVLLIVSQVIYYSITFFRVPKRYHKQLNDEYSNIDKFSINWLKWFNSSFVVVGLLSILFYMFNPFKEENDFFLVVFLFTISAFTWVIGIWSFKQEKPEITEQAETVLPMSNKLTADMVNQELVKSLITYFEEKEPFLQPDLCLTTVCKEIGTNRTYLSSVINGHFNMNFNAFVNQYRTKYVNDYLKKHPNTSKENLALIGGFGSISSLKRALDKAQGIVGQK